MDIDKGKSFISQIVEQIAPGLRDKISSTARTNVSLVAQLKQSPASLLKDHPGLTYPQAMMLQQRFDVVARTLARRKRELRQQGIPPLPQERKGLESLTLPLTYESQFSPNWSQNTLPDAIDSSQGPVAYLIDILLFLEEMIEPLADANKAVFLRERREDIYKILLDEESVQRLISNVEIINQILASAIERHTGERDLDKLLRNVRFPYRFPFEYYLHQIHAVLDSYSLSMGDVKRDCSPDYPYFTRSGLHGQGSDTAVWLDSRLGPQLRAILLSSSIFGSQLGFADPLSKKRMPKTGTVAAQTLQTDYFKQNFGVEQFTELRNVTVFCQQLKLDRKDLERLISRGEEQPRLSPNVTSETYKVQEEGRLVDPSVYGSVFINTGTSPSINVSNGANGEYHRFVGLSETRCERIERFLRLARALSVTFEQLDMLLVAIMRAEQRSSEAQNDEQWNISSNTLRALGLCVQLQRQLKCTVEQCCALFDGIGLYSRGKGISHFDQLFNSDERFSYRFVLDGAPLEERDINRICSVFGINYDTFSYLALVVRQVFDMETLIRSREVISAFYRPVVLANLLKIRPLELLALLKTMNPDAQFERGLLGMPENRVYQAYDQADVVSLIHALISVHRWGKENDLSVAQIFNWISPSITADREEKIERQLLDELKQRTTSELFTNQALWTLNVPDSVDWVKELIALVNTTGIVLDTSHGFDSQGYETWAQQQVDAVVQDKLKNKPEDKRQQVSQTILAVLLEKRTAQWKSVIGVLEGYLGSKTDNIAPALYWSGSGSTMLLTELMEGGENTKLMQILSNLRRYEQIISHFRLEPAMMAQLLSYDNRDWYGLAMEQPSLLMLYRISLYRQIVDDGQQKQEADNLLNYLEMVNTLPEEGSEDAMRLYRDQTLNKLSLFFGWSINELLTVAQFLVPQDAIIRTLPQLLMAKRIHKLCLQTGLSARSVISLADLNEASGSSEYQWVAEQMLESLTHQDISLYSNDESNQGDLTASVQASGTLLVANNEDGDSVVLTLTLRTLEGQPRVGIPINWEKTTEPGILLDFQDKTDANGQATATIGAGEVQGMALVKAYYGVKAIALPGIRIDSDENTLGISDSNVDPAIPVPADGKTRVKVSVWLYDELGNTGIDKSMRWEISGGRFVYVQSLTDGDGMSVAEVVSDEPGTAVVKVNYERSNDDGTEFVIKFESSK